MRIYYKSASTIVRTNARAVSNVVLTKITRYYKLLHQVYYYLIQNRFF